jgi:hypothetical protein
LKLIDKMKYSLATALAIPLAAHAGDIGGTALLGPYPNTLGSPGTTTSFVSVTKKVGSETDSGEITVTYALEFTAGEAGNCTSSAGAPLPCSGGLHVHDGVDACGFQSATTNVGGHYYDGRNTDPWTTKWTSQDGGLTAKGSFDITTSGLPLSTYGDHVVVVHDTSGARIKCGNIIGVPSTGAIMADYPGTTSGVRGSVSVSNTETIGTVQVAYSLTGLPNAAGDTGGLHIHAGVTCDDADEVLGHYWFPETDTDPWDATTVWEAKPNGDINGWFLAPAGLSIGSADKHAVVVHNTTGDRVACGTLSKTNLIMEIKGSSNVAALQDGYPGYTGENTANGQVTVSDGGTGDSLTLDYKLWLQGDTVGTSGGLHIHAGVSCDSADLVGPHYWAGGDDPWGDYKWTNPGTNGYSNGTITATLQYPLRSNVGHAVVIHDNSGARIACTTISGDYYKSTFTRYPCRDEASADPAEIIGHMIAASDNPNDGTISYSYAIKSTEKSVVGGLHVHTGTTCPTAGGHYYSSDYPMDPWLTKYSTTDAVTGVSYGMFNLDDGLDFASHRNRATVAHFEDGARAACGTLDGDSADTFGVSAPTCPPEKKKGALSPAAGVSATVGAVVVCFAALLM